MNVPPWLNRRQFVLAAVALAAGCGPRPAPSPSPPPPGSPAPPQESPATPALQPAPPEFMALSAALCGVAVEDLDSGLAARYHAALQTPPPGGTPLEQVYGKAGASPTLEGLEKAGFFDDAPTKATADALLAAWYTGTAGGQVVTYTQALGWTQLRFTHAITECHQQWWLKPPGV